jgi:plasmid stabilization system protein ParE
VSLYSVIFRQRAIKEYAESTAWYKEHSFQAADNFVKIVDSTVNAILANPYSFRNSYKKFYEAKTKKYPFSIIYFIDENKQYIVITSIFHNKRNPVKKYR